jgi:glycerophosphoryl diester phosphodiesterase
MLRRVLAGLLAVAAAGCASVQNKPLYKDIELHGHRGARGLMPENTWPAFAAALEHGMTVLELDTVLTAEGDLIIHHDIDTNPQLCRNDDGSAIHATAIRGLKVADLKKLDCGSLGNEKFPDQKKVPGTRLITLDEFFGKMREVEINDAAKRRITFNIEAKFPKGVNPTENELQLFATTLTGKVASAGMAGRTTLQSFELKILPLLKAKNSEIKISALFEPTYWQGFRMYMRVGDGPRDAIITAAVEAKADIISPYKLYASDYFVHAAHAKKLAVIPWTVNEKSEMVELLRRGVDGIISDYPDRLKAAYAEVYAR